MTRKLLPRLAAKPLLAAALLILGLATVTAAGVGPQVASAFGLGPAKASHAYAQPSGPTAPTTPTPACTGTWGVVPVPAAAFGDYLGGIAAIADNDIWAVGEANHNPGFTTLTEHWDGSSWSIVPSPNGPGDNSLNDVEAVSGSDVWAVGSFQTGPGNQSLIEHWNGTYWTIVPSPIPPGSNDTLLFGVSAVAWDDVWAVGTYNSNGLYHLLVQHWNGTAWSTVNAPDTGTASSLEGVTALSANDVWAVGFFVLGDYHTLTEHWDGTSWTIVPSPDPAGASGSRLSGISGVAANDMWATGDYSNGSIDQTLVEHWDGSIWAVVPSPNITSWNNDLHRVTALSTGDVWAVGYSWDTLDTVRNTLVEHWDGKSWSIVPSPTPGGSNFGYLVSVAALSAGDVWAVGAYDTGSRYSALVEHYTVACGTLTPTVPPPTLTPTGTPGCSGSWDTVASANGTPDNRLNGVAALSSNNVWAVGWAHALGWSYPGYDTLVEHWDGSTWSLVSSPNPGGNSADYLNAISAVAPNDIWAAGGYSNHNLTEHWDGTAWSFIESPQPPGNGNSLNGVAAVSHNDVWAVGSNSGTSGLSAFILHWDGTQWSMTTIPTPGSSSELFAAVAIAQNNVWAVGRYYDNATQLDHTLTLHWDGSAWGLVPSDNIAYVNDYLLAVAGTAANDVWAVGYTQGAEVRSLALHFDGTAWHVVLTPQVRSINYLRGVTALGNNRAVAVGSYVGDFATERTLALYYDGSQWTQQDTPNINTLEHRLFAVTSLSPLDIWAVGHYRSMDGGNPYDTLALHYQGTCPTAIPTSTATSISSPTPTSTATSGAASSPAATVSGSATATGTATHPAVQSTDTPTPLSSITAGLTPTICSVEFSDVPVGSTFYQYVHCLACRGIISGYANGTFGPNNPVTRGQLSKIVSNSAGYSETFTTNTFEDVPVGSTFFPYVERLYAHGGIGGYACGNPEPCVPPGNKPYFRPGANVTRGQTSKIVAIAKNLPPPSPGQQTFEDVPPGSTFWQWIEPLVATGAIQGYQCGGTGEPCEPPGNRPYFRPGANVTRGQSAKIVSNAFFPGCSTPAR